MTEMTAFERRVADGMLHRAGPVRPVDDLAIFEAVTAASRSHRWGFTMFSALKFVAAAVIVALFGGFLLAGILATPQDGEVFPAAVTESPSPMTTGELLSGMVTEEVEPGVYRVIDDGVRDLSSADYWGVVAGEDGSIWLGGSGDLFRLGVTETHDWQLGEWNGLWDFEIGHDGTVWAVAVNDEGQALRSFDGEAWATHRAVEYFSGQDGDVEVVSDGVVWAALGDGTLGYLAADGSTWQTIETPKARPATVAAGPLLPAEEDDQWGLFGQDIWEFGFIATESDAWTPYFGGVSHYADGEWEHVPYGGPDTEALPDDVFWGLGQAVDDGPVLYRHDGTGWQQWFLGEDDRLAVNWLVGPHAMAPDGNFWAVRPDCLGVNRFDGRTWVEYLPGICADDMDIAFDGSVWLLADDLYVITPEAVAATE
ncbi:MAG: hypothetical protein U9O18_01170 [Chloroflexota bacterium]|nr:hypothetical protein [Chloroflexota bacterium]